MGRRRFDVTTEHIFESNIASAVRLARYLGVPVKDTDNKWRIACKISRHLKRGTPGSAPR